MSRTLDLKQAAGTANWPVAQTRDMRHADNRERHTRLVLFGVVIAQSTVGSITWLMSIVSTTNNQ